MGWLVDVALGLVPWQVSDITLVAVKVARITSIRRLAVLLEAVVTHLTW